MIRIKQYRIMMVVVGVVLVVGLLSSAIIAPTVAASEDSEGDRSMEIAGHFAQTETAPNETTASNKTATSNGTTTSNTSQASRPANASLNVDENETTPSRVSLSSVSLPANGFIVVHNGSYSPASPDSNSIIGRTQYVRGGNFTDVYVPLFNISGREFNRSQITGTQQVHVLLYNDSNGNQAFDSADDQPYRNSSGLPIVGSTVVDGAQTEATQTESPQAAEDARSVNASVTIDGNRTTSSRVTLSSAVVPTNGFIVVHNESYSPASPQSDSIIGRTQYVRGGNYTDVVIDLYNDSDRKFNRSQTTSTRQVSVLVYNDSNGDSTFDPGEDTPYQNSSGYPISDSTIIEGIDTGRLASGTDSPASQPSQSSPSSSTSITAAQSPDQSSQRATGGQQSSGTSIGGSGFLQTVASVVLVVLGGLLVYRGLHK
jgi:hypothetical protein